ncbi:MAG: 30S ribosomal protein S16 [Bdellovibrionales bacterium]|nr:30S ribosomal protein S16 [Bdellovibrionales bacterium]
MAVTLRLTRRGQHKRPFYRIVAADQQRRRDGRFLEIVGTYNPMVDPPAINLKEDRVRSWIESGAQTSNVVRSLIVKNIPGLIEGREEAKKQKIKDARSKRKQGAPKAKREKRVKRGRKSLTAKKSQ